MYVCTLHENAKQNIKEKRKQTSAGNCERVVNFALGTWATKRNKKKFIEKLVHCFEFNIWLLSSCFIAEYIYIYSYIYLCIRIYFSLLHFSCGIPAASQVLACFDGAFASLCFALAVSRFWTSDVLMLSLTLSLLE